MADGSGSALRAARKLSDLTSGHPLSRQRRRAALDELGSRNGTEYLARRIRFAGHEVVWRGRLARPYHGLSLRCRGCAARRSLLGFPSLESDARAACACRASATPLWDAWETNSCNPLRTVTTGLPLSHVCCTHLPPHGYVARVTIHALTEYQPKSQGLTERETRRRPSPPPGPWLRRSVARGRHASLPSAPRSRTHTGAALKADPRTEPSSNRICVCVDR